jgi:hypothetical protein
MSLRASVAFPFEHLHLFFQADDRVLGRVHLPRQRVILAVVADLELLRLVFLRFLPERDDLAVGVVALCEGRPHCRLERRELVFQRRLLRLELPDAAGEVPLQLFELIETGIDLLQCEQLP